MLPSLAQILWTGLTAVIFLLWTGAMFTTLFRLRRAATEATGRMFPGPRGSLRSVATFLRDPRNRGARRRLGWLTLLLFAALAMQAVCPVCRPGGG